MANRGLEAQFPITTYAAMYLLYSSVPCYPRIVSCMGVANYVALYLYRAIIYKGELFDPWYSVVTKSLSGLVQKKTDYFSRYRGSSALFSSMDRVSLNTNSTLVIGPPFLSDSSPSTGPVLPPEYSSP